MLGSYGSRYSCIGSMLATSPTFAAQWDWVNGTLAKQADDITSAEFGKLAWWLTKQTTIEGQERFLNMFLEPVTLPPGVTNNWNVTPFSICPQKVAGVQHFMQSGIETLMNTQSYFPFHSDSYLVFQYQRDRLMRLSALLTVVDSLTDHGVNIVTGGNITRNGVQQRLILGQGEYNPIRLSAGEPNGVAVSFARGVMESHNVVRYYHAYGQPPLTGGRVSLRPVNTSRSGISLRHNVIDDSTITISDVYYGSGIASEHLRGLLSEGTGFFYLRHQFDLQAHIAAGVLDLTRSVATMKVPDKVTFGLDLAIVFASIAEARMGQWTVLCLTAIVPQ